MSAQGRLALDPAPARYGLDGPLCLAVAVLLGWGLVMVASASVAQAEKLTGASTLVYFERQALFALFGLVLAAVLIRVPMQVWYGAAGTLLILALVLLLVVAIPGIGIARNGAQRWLAVGPIMVQVSEPARLLIVLFIAGYVTRRQLALQTSLKGLLIPLLIVVLPVSLLLLKQRDFGATVILVGVVLTMLFVGGARLRDLATISGPMAAGLAAFVLTEPYRVRRVLSYLHPDEDQQGANYQLTQAKIAIARGGFDGVGLGNSLQKLQYLPENHTDFIFAVLAEEFGLLGVLLLTALYVVLVWRGFAIGRIAESLNARFNAYVCYGISIWFGLQVLINFGVNLGALPTKGLTLPFMSYGGSSLVTVCLMVALLLRVDHENRYLQAGHPGTGRRSGPPPVPSRHGTGEGFGWFRRRGVRA